jgi:hypothetical protein
MAIWAVPVLAGVVVSLTRQRRVQAELADSPARAEVVAAGASQPEQQQRAAMAALEL